MGKGLMAMLLLTIGLAAVTEAAPAASPAPSASGMHRPLDPYTIYGRCVDAMRRNPHPAFASYMLQVDKNHFNVTRAYDDAGAPTTTLHFGLNRGASTYRVWYRSSDARSLMQDLASSATDIGPPVPWALDFHTQREPQPTASPREQVKAGSVTVDRMTRLLNDIGENQSSFYHIALARIENYNGHPAYHLNLQSTSGDPNAHPLRDLIVDAKSFRAWQLTMEVGQRSTLFAGTLQLHASFSPVGRYWLNTEGGIDGGGHYAFLHLNGSYTFRAVEFNFPRKLPDWYFDAARFKRHSSTVAGKQ